MTIAREEIFGPVGTVIAYTEPAEAIRLANDTKYGLAASIWTQDVSQAHTLARQVRAGAVWVNGWAAIDPALPWGGYDRPVGAACSRVTGPAGARGMRRLTRARGLRRARPLRRDC